MYVTAIRKQGWMPARSVLRPAARASAAPHGENRVAARATRSLPLLLSGFTVAAGPAIASIADLPEPTERLAYDAAELALSVSKLSYPTLVDPSAAVAGAAASVAIPDVDPELLSNPLVVGGAVAAVAIPLVFRAVFGGRGQKVRGISAAAAFEALAEEEALVAIDIRSSADVKASGTPDLRSTKKPLKAVPFSKVAEGELVVDEDAFAAKLAKVANPAESTLLLIDSFGADAPKAAKIAASAGFSTVLFVNGGCEGNRGWKESGLPWKEPFRGIDMEMVKNLDITGVSKLADRLASEYRERPTLIKGGLALAAAGAAAFVLFNELEIILEVLGVWAAFQFVATKLLFADDREQTFSQLKELLEEKIAAGEAGSDLRKLASALFASESAHDIQAAASDEPSAKTEEIESLADFEITERRADAQEWIAAWRERTSVKVMA